MSIVSSSTDTSVSAERPLLSVVFTTHTMERLPDVEELLRALHQQTYRNLEFIFVGEQHPEIVERIKDFAHRSGMNNLTALFNEYHLQNQLFRH